jgi:hypothetical protein
MTAIPLNATESARLEALVKARVGWQLLELEVWVEDAGLRLTGLASCNSARQMARVEAEQWSGLPVLSNEITVTRPTCLHQH